MKKEKIKQAIQAALFFGSSCYGFIAFFINVCGSPLTILSLFVAIILGSLSFFGLTAWIYRS